MNPKNRFHNALITIFMLISLSVNAQNSRTQFPAGLKNAYFGVNIGYINYPFSSAQLEPGYQVESVRVPHIAVRIVLYGMPLNKYLSVRITYMRPVQWVRYNNINGDNKSHSVWMNIAGLTLDGRIPIAQKISLTTEAGLGIITRSGFNINDKPVVTDASYATGLFSGTFQYHLNKRWDLHLTAVSSPQNKKFRQPESSFMGAGFNYHMLPLPQSEVEKNANSGYEFPRHLILAGYSTNVMGYGINKFVANPYFPVFWGGDVKVKQGITLSYQRNVFHGRKFFALDISASISYWQSTGLEERYYTLSMNPVFRFYALHLNTLDLFFEYSLAGPTFISKAIIDERLTGEKFTFYDFMGMGAFLGQNKNIYAGIRIAHHSNGNLFPHNPGLMIPLTFNLGYVLN